MHWIVIYPVDSVIHVSNNWGQDSHSVSPSVGQKPGGSTQKSFLPAGFAPRSNPFNTFYISL